MVHPIYLLSVLTDQLSGDDTLLAIAFLGVKVRNKPLRATDVKINMPERRDGVIQGLGAWVPGADPGFWSGEGPAEF